MEILEEKEVREYTVTKYKAFDGTLFTDKGECEIYESTAECVIRSKVKIHAIDEWALSFGDEDHCVDIVKGDIEALKHYAMSRCFIGTATKDETFNYLLGLEDTGKTNCILVYYNCDGEVYKVVSYKDFIARIESHLSWEPESENKEKEEK